MSRLVSLAVLFLGSSIGLLGCAQGLESGSSASRVTPVQRPDSASIRSEWQSDALDSLPWASDSVHSLQDPTNVAFGAAEVDPGILMYTEPPPGTRTPVYTPPDSVDPDMIWRPKP